MDTSGRDGSNLVDDEIFSDFPHMQLDAISRPKMDTQFLPTAFDRLENGRSVENHILHENEEGSEMSPPTTSVCERPIDPLPCDEVNCLE